jgi:hypothetical protein
MVSANHKSRRRLLIPHPSCSGGAAGENGDLVSLVRPCPAARSILRRPDEPSSPAIPDQDVRPETSQSSCNKAAEYCLRLLSAVWTVSMQQSVVQICSRGAYGTSEPPRQRISLTLDLISTPLSLPVFSLLRKTTFTPPS